VDACALGCVVGRRLISGPVRDDDDDDDDDVDNVVVVIMMVMMMVVMMCADHGHDLARVARG
jgi:hypothetical protein